MRQTLDHTASQYPPSLCSLLLELKEEFIIIFILYLFIILLKKE